MEELHLRALELAIDAELAAGRHAEAIGRLEALIAEHPARERFHAQRMLALYRADLALDVHGPEFGPVMRSMILFTCYVGARLDEACALEWPWIDFGPSEVTFKIAKFDKPGTVLLLDDAAQALRSIPRRADEHPQVFRSKRGLPLRGRSAHYWSWNPVRAAFWGTLPEHRRRAIADLDWHSLRHFCGWHFYVQLGFTDELTAYQLGHADAKLVRDLYGHGRADALDRLKRGARVKIRPIRATSLPHAAGETA